MTLFDESELAGMRDAQEAHMPHQCQLGARSSSRNAMGEVVSSYTFGDSVPCGFGPTPRGEMTTMEGTVVTTDAMLRLPSDVEVDVDWQVKLTHRFGEELSVPEVFNVQGVAPHGPSALTLNLRRVTT